MLDTAANLISPIMETRRLNLKNWLDGKALPKREKSYFSQLLTGAIPFGERAARRIEREYNLPVNFLDVSVSENAQTKKEMIDTIMRKLDTMPLCKLNALNILLNE